MMHAAIADHQPYSDRKTVPTGGKADLPLRRVKRLAVNRHNLQLTRVIFWRRMPLDADECPWLTSGTQAGVGYKEDECSNDAHSSNENKMSDACWERAPIAVRVCRSWKT